MSDSAKEQHRLGTINRWDPPEGDWAAEYNWTRYRGPHPWPVPGGWIFKDPEGGGWWQYYGELGVGHHSRHDILETLESDESVDDPFEVLEDAAGPYAYLSAETANPDEVSMLNYEDEELEWSLEVDGLSVFRRVEPEQSDLLATVAEALYSLHVGNLEARHEDIVPTSGRKPDDVFEREALERKRQVNGSLEEYASSGGVTDE